jgi:hypothetical protein
MPLEEEFHHAMISVADFANAHNFVIRFRQMIQEWSVRCGEADRGAVSDHTGFTIDGK